MNSYKKIGMDKILSELNLDDSGVDGIYHFDIKDKFFVGGGCEVSWISSSDKSVKPSTFKNIAICSEAVTK